ncbi:MAG: hypothetical protein A3H59_03320 [Candidatus Jacksonbacteria bacterium RIFCSPLOWO2_02_FULL_43_9]|nr:MAG: rRNA (Adenine-N6-)-methyltransferase [Parcubacteria group bacterium GW2011_GWA2_43_13]OGY68468.1 MAG: hypothetical protein A3B94_02835 [Candidatus Jacksonbacteria bacterium RIFCSPHIGHO2_02_FULL_43_10]OGY70731.1 MAG: hypothetical protein A2986_03095 [Candidatus Jacksonbacteria bacterium RIFCSPLOWO2_01_FULL_44_13]OGY72217.1 MAG: hypothetical protein A3H59_03320 [Candidatus Jacksonbacteria bacterium RIFCSPLOWO2_02_FULL_43_9]HAZ16674.1 hypothetical protein [Candidatus Jacksonbacteria bacter
MPTIVVSEQFLKPKDILITSGIAQGMRIADLGCGNGYIAKVAAQLVGPTGVVFAADVQRPILQQLERDAFSLGLSNIHTVWTDLEIVGATNIPPDSIDITCLVNVLFLSQHKELMVQEAIRLTKQGGKVLVVDWKRTSTPFGPLPDDRVDMRMIDEIATKLGLVKIDSFEAGTYHDAQVYQK